MNARSLLMTAGVLVFAGVLSFGRNLHAQPPSQPDERAADRKAILDSGREFEGAFEKKDAKAVAAFWTENGEYEADSGEQFRGRSAIDRREGG